MSDVAGPSGPSGGPAGLKAGWYRNRATGQRRFWNGVVWVDIPSAITPFTYEPGEAGAPGEAGEAGAPVVPAALPPEGRDVRSTHGSS